MKITEADKELSKVVLTEAIADIATYTPVKAGLLIAEAMKPEREAAREMARVLKNVDVCKDCPSCGKCDRGCELHRSKYRAIKAYEEATK